MKILVWSLAITVGFPVFSAGGGSNRGVRNDANCTHASQDARIGRDYRRVLQSLNSEPEERDPRRKKGQTGKGVR